MPSDRAISILASLFELDTLMGVSKQRRQALLRALVDLVSEEDDDMAQELLAIAALHPDPDVRAATLEIPRSRPGHDSNQRIVSWAVQDPDESVAAGAARIAADRRMGETTSDLLSVTGRCPDTVRYGSDIPATVCDHIQTSALRLLIDTPAGREALLNLPTPLAADPNAIVNNEGMVHVLEGTLDPAVGAEHLPGWFPNEFLENTSPWEVEEFWIDIEPVTNAEYDEFVEAIESTGHIFCHPDEPADKLHRRTFVNDERFSQGDPVVGIDWYDAYGYASWKGKSLPTEDEWERAARGDSGLIFPWGNESSSDNVRGAEATFARAYSDRKEWEDHMASVDFQAIDQLTLPAKALPDNVSPFGALGMSGNAWEWTSTRFLDRMEIEPHFGTLYPVETIGDWSAYLSIKGGSWSSIADLLSPAFRVKRHIFSRSPEVSFRCVRRT